MDRRSLFKTSALVAPAALWALYAQATGVPRTSSYLQSNSFPLAGPAGGITPQQMQDFVVSVPGIWTKLNVLNFGATGNGSTNDTAAFTSAIAALPASGGLIYAPAGQYLLNPNAISLPAHCSLVGEGFGTNFLINGNGSYLIDLSAGASTNSPNLNQMLANFQISGNNSSGVVGIRGYYNQELMCSNLFGNYISGGFCSFAQLWDSRFFRIEAIGCSGNTSTPVMNLQNSAASSGAGLSLDTTNQCFFSDIHLEVFAGQAIALTQGPGNSAGGPNGMYFSRVKLENETYQGQPFIYIGGGPSANSFSDIYLSVDSATGGSPGYCIQNAGGGTTYWKDIQCNMNQANICTNFWYQDTYGADVIDTIMWNSPIGPSGAILAIAGVQPIILNGVISWAGGLTPYSGAPTAAPTSGQYYQGTFIRNIGGANMSSISGWLCTASGSPGTWRALA